MQDVKWLSRMYDRGLRGYTMVLILMYYGHHCGGVYIQPGSLVLIFTRVTTVDVVEECTAWEEEPGAVGCSRRLLAEDPQLI